MQGSKKEGHSKKVSMAQPVSDDEEISDDEGKMVICEDNNDRESNIFSGSIEIKGERIRARTCKSWNTLRATMEKQLRIKHTCGQLLAQLPLVLIESQLFPWGLGHLPFNDHSSCKESQGSSQQTWVNQ